MNSFYKTFWTARAGQGGKSGQTSDSSLSENGEPVSKTISREVLSALSELGDKEIPDELVSKKDSEEENLSNPLESDGVDGKNSIINELAAFESPSDESEITAVIREEDADLNKPDREVDGADSLLIAREIDPTEDEVIGSSDDKNVDEVDKNQTQEQPSEATSSEISNEEINLVMDPLVNGDSSGDSEILVSGEASINSSEVSTLNIANLGKRLMMNTIAKNSLHLAANGKEYAPQEDSPLYATEKMLYDAQKSIALNEELIEAGKVTTQICETVTFKGDINFGGNGGSIAGIIEGNIVVEGHGVLYLAPSSQVRGNIKARNIIAEGKINGNIVCERIIATSTAVLIGDVMYKDVFNPAPGAKVQGSLQSNPDVFHDDTAKASEHQKVALGTV